MLLSKIYNTKMSQLMEYHNTQTRKAFVNIHFYVNLYILFLT